LSDLELTVATGPVVDFRSREQISQEPRAGTVPLLYPIHFNGKDVDWPQRGKKANAIAYNSETNKMLFPNGYYTVVRRFSSKEEKQRIIARVINPTKLNYSYIGIENHLNVFHWQKEGISEDLAYGLAAYLNSSVVDTHFRSFNGHTQVNATDLRQMKYPSLDALMKFGQWAKELNSFDQEIIDIKIQDLL
jgi:adenine-specific DNA-methyltransferase